MIDSATGLPLTNPDSPPWKKPPEIEAISASAEGMILSASGWRKIFAASGDEESDEPAISEPDEYLALLAAHCWAQFFQENAGGSSSPQPVILLGMDSRPTGPALAECAARLFLARGLDVRYLFITAAPEIMAGARGLPEAGGFFYLSASHNPLGHNGLKGGLKTGGVLTGSQSAPLAEAFRQGVRDADLLSRLRREARSVPASEIHRIYRESPREKERVRQRYWNFLKEIMAGSPEEAVQKGLTGRIRRALRDSPLGIVAELNGSARTLSVDTEFLTSLGASVLGVNSRPRQIAHRIVPEGASLEPCRRILEERAAGSESWQLGYVPDNDGDRGNLTALDRETGKAFILQAQEVFALTVLAELSAAAAAGTPMEDTAVAVNGPTSLRIDRIAEAFGARVYRAEVGEANVVQLSEELSKRGLHIRILGEGSNGGSIIRPAAVRDPLNTLSSLTKLLRLPLPKDTGADNLFHLWCLRQDIPEAYSPRYGLSDILKTLPPFSTTSAYEPEAVMQISSTDHGRLKTAFENQFLQSWERRGKKLLDQYGISSWEEINYEGTEEKRGFGPDFRTGPQRGGLKILLKDGRNRSKGFLWMRGSGTEPVFRIMADIESRNPKAEAELLLWLREMVERADRTAAP